MLNCQKRAEMCNVAGTKETVSGSLEATLNISCAPYLKHTLTTRERINLLLGDNISCTGLQPICIDNGL